MKWAGRKTGGCISRRGETGRDRLWALRGKVEKTERDCLWCRADAEGRRVIRTKIYFVGGPSSFITSSVMWVLRRQVHKTLVPSHEYSYSPLAPDDFTPNCEMNGFTDYMSNAFCSSSLCDAQMEHSANTHVFAYPHTQGIFKMGILPPC